jgi:hypothetical protein
MRALRDILFASHSGGFKETYNFVDVLYFKSKKAGEKYKPI